MSNKRKKVLETIHLDASTGTISFPGEADGNILTFNSGLRTWLGKPPSSVGGSSGNSDESNNSKNLGGAWTVNNSLNNAIVPSSTSGTYQIGIKPNQSLPTSAPITDITSKNFHIPSTVSNGNYTTFSGNNFTQVIVYSMPASQGAAGSFLRNDGSGGLSWAKVTDKIVSAGTAISVTSTPGTDQVTYTVNAIPSEILKPWIIENDPLLANRSHLRPDDPTRSFDLGVAPGSANTFARGSINTINAKSFTFINSVTTGANLSTKILGNNFSGAIEWTLPADQGAADTVLTNDGSGALAWNPPNHPVVVGTGSATVTSQVTSGVTTYTVSVPPPSVGSTGTVTQISAGTGIKATPDPITTTGVISLRDNLTPYSTTTRQLINSLEVDNTGRIISLATLPTGNYGDVLTLLGTQFIWEAPTPAPPTYIYTPSNAGISQQLSVTTYTLANTQQNQVSSGYGTLVTTSNVTKSLDGTPTVVGTNYSVSTDYRLETSIERPANFASFQTYTHATLTNPSNVMELKDVHSGISVVRRPVVNMAIDRKGRVLDAQYADIAPNRQANTGNLTIDTQRRLDQKVMWLKFTDLNNGIIGNGPPFFDSALDLITLNSDIYDVVMTGLSEHHVLLYDQIDGKWRNQLFPAVEYILPNGNPVNPGSALVFDYLVGSPTYAPLRDFQGRGYLNVGINYRNFSPNFCGIASFTAVPDPTNGTPFTQYPTRKTLPDAGTNNCTGMFRMGQSTAVARGGFLSDLGWFDQSYIPANPAWCTAGIGLSNAGGVWSMDANDPWNYMKVKAYACFASEFGATGVWGRLLLTGWLSTPPKGEDWNPGNFDNYGGAGGYLGFQGYQMWQTTGIPVLIADPNKNPVFTRLGPWVFVPKASDIKGKAELDVAVRRGDMINTNMNFAVYVEMAANAKNPQTDTGSYENSAVPIFRDETGGSISNVDQFRYTDSNNVYPGPNVTMNPGHVFIQGQVFPFMELSVEICS
jgi:hypothetical protein